MERQSEVKIHVGSWAVARGLTEQGPGRRRARRPGTRKSRTEACDWENVSAWSSKSFTLHVNAHQKAHCKGRGTIIG